MLLFFVLFHPTLISMWQTWGDSDTYAHGYLVFPIAGFLIWRKRHELAQLRVQPLYWPLIMVLLLGLGWLMARLLSVQVVEQTFFVALILVLVTVLFGWRFFTTLLFPLVFLDEHNLVFLPRLSFSHKWI